MNASLLVRQSETRKLFVNFDPVVFELIAEARYLHKLHLEIPDAAMDLCKQEDQIKEYHVEWVIKCYQLYTMAGSHEISKASSQRSENSDLLKAKQKFLNAMYLCEQEDQMDLPFQKKKEN